MSRLAIVFAALLCCLPAGAEPPEAAQAELARTEETLQQLIDLRAQVTALEERLDGLIRSLSEHKGALANAKPAAFGGVVASGSALPDRPDPKPRVVRCAALTKEGDRCSRAALAGSRYCKQHMLARTK